MRNKRTFTTMTWAGGPWIWAVVGLACALGWRAAAQPAVAETASPNRVLALPGNGSHAERVWKPATAPKALTIEGWMRIDVLRSGTAVWSVGDTNASLTLRTQANPAEFVLESRVRQDAGDGFVMSVGSVLAVRQWCHVAVLVGPGQARVYFNGTLVASNAIPQTAGPIPQAGAVRIGRSVNPVSVLDQTLGA